MNPISYINLEDIYKYAEDYMYLKIEFMDFTQNYKIDVEYDKIDYDMNLSLGSGPSSLILYFNDVNSKYKYRMYNDIASNVVRMDIYVPEDEHWYEGFIVKYADLM